MALSRRVKDDVMRSHPDVCERIRHRMGGLQQASPGFYRDEIVPGAACWNDVFATGKAPCRNGARMLEELVFGPARDNFAFVHHQQIAAEAKCFLHIVGDKDNGAVVAGKVLAKLLLHLPSQMRIEG